MKTCDGFKWNADKVGDTADENRSNLRFAGRALCSGALDAGAKCGHQIHNVIGALLSDLGNCLPLLLLIQQVLQRTFEGFCAKVAK